MASNPQKFAAEFGKMLVKAGAKAEQVVKKSAMSIMVSVEKKSPVGDPETWLYLHPQKQVYVDYLTYREPPAGYTGGQFRANWNLSVTGLDTSTTADKDPSGGAAIGRAQSAIESYKIGDTITISNSLPYAHRLEYEGWSNQAPNGMIRLTVLEFEQYVAQQAAKIR